VTARALRIASLLAALALGVAGCASRAGEAPSPEALACVQDSGEVRAREYAERLRQLQERARAFAACMGERGFVLDQAKLEAELLRLEQVGNAQWLGGDPQLELALREQELRASPEFWRRGG
jgi:hypothetical protein